MERRGTASAAPHFAPATAADGKAEEFITVRARDDSGARSAPQDRAAAGA